MFCNTCWSSPTTKDAYRLTITTLVVEILATIGGIRLFKSTGSSLSLVWGLENLVDFISSCVVLWRFFAPTSVDAVLEKKLQQREERASIAISFLMIALGLCILSASISDFSRGQEDSFHENAILLLSFFSILLFGTLSMIKFRYASKLDSESMYKDGVCSVIGTFLSLALFLNTIVVMNNPAIWWIDPIAAFVAGVAAMILGIHSLWIAHAVTKLPIFTSAWWLQKDIEITVQNKGDDVNDANDVTDVDLDDHDII